MTAPLQLTAGPITLLYENGYIRSLFLGSVELLRRIYVAVRDPYWNTIEYEVSNEVFSLSEKHFQIHFDCHHRRGEIDFRWRGRVSGSESGEVTFSMDGEAISAFKTLRIGFCILHPLSLKGVPAEIQHPDGTLGKAEFPQSISAHQIFKNVSRISFSPRAQINATIEMFGSTFETEDQRNWTDATFKTYCPPIDQQGLRLVTPKETFSQCIKLIATGTSEANNTNAMICLNENAESYAVPEIGTAVYPQVKFTDAAARRLGAAALSHVRIDIDVSAPDIGEQIKRAASIAESLETNMELALFFTDEYVGEITRLLVSLGEEATIPVKRFLIFHRNRAVTPNYLVASLREALTTYAPESFVGGGTDNYYVEINRENPSTDNLDFICFSATPQVHTFDNAAVMENAAGLAEVLKDVQRFSNDLPIVVSPLTIRPRKRRTAPLKDGGADSRLREQFGASWTLASFISCAAQNLRSITCHTAFGDDGLMDENGSAVGPALYLIGFIQAFKGGTCLVVKTGKPHLNACILKKGSERRLLIANCASEKKRVDLNCMSHKRARVLILDQTMPMETAGSPEELFCSAAKEVDLTDSMLHLELRPYAVGCVGFC